MRVQIVYRSYKPLHDLYASLKIYPPESVVYVIPSPRLHLRRLLPLHRKFGNNIFLKSLTYKMQGFLFDKEGNNADIYHFTQMISPDTPTKPYVVDFEHAIALANFSRIDRSIAERIFRFIKSPQCCKIMPLSQAADHSLKSLLSEQDYRRVAKKIEVVYPALPNYYKLHRDEVNHSHVSKDPNPLRILFVGNDVYRKGLHELLRAFEQLEQRDYKLELYVISNAPKKLRQRYRSRNIKFFEPKFSHDDIIKQFYLPCDLFVLPTHNDSFGMAMLYSLSCGTPVLTTRQFAAPEIVTPKQNGLFANSDRLYLESNPLPERGDRSDFYGYDNNEEVILVNDLVSKIEHLYLNRDLVKQMGQNALQDFEPGGKFSIDVRNRKLGQIYRSCL